MYERSGYNWSSLGTSWGSDPIPGSPEVVDTCAVAYRGSADNLTRAIQNLRNLHSAEDTTSEAVEKIMAKATAVAGTLDQVRERYDTISRALNGYSPQLRDAQRMSIQAVQEATAAVRERQEARARNEAARAKSVTVDQAVRDQALQEYHQSRSDYLRADAKVESAKALLANAISKRDAAGETARGMIAGCIEDSSLNDTIGDYLSAAWEKISKVVESTLKWIWDHIDQICLVLDVLSVILMLTGVGGPVAAALQLVSRAAKVAHVLSKVKMGVNLLKNVYTGLKTGDWNGLVSAGLSFGLSWAGGKILGKVTDRLGSAASKWVTSAVDARNLKLHVRTEEAAGQIVKKTFLNGNPVDSIAKKVVQGSALPSYFAAAPTVSKLFTSKNDAASELAPIVQGSLSLMKGSDYSIVKPYTDQLAKLAATPTITTAVRNELGELADTAVHKAVNDVVHRTADRLSEEIVQGIDDRRTYCKTGALQ